MKRILTTLSQKWPEYLIESVVIVASILGAYALDNWNENRKAKIEKIELVNLLIVDYEGNLLQLNQKIKLHEAVITSGFAIIDDFDHPTASNLDTLLENLLIIGMDPTFDPSTNNLLEGGRIGYIKNPELIGLISNWSSDIVALRELELVSQDIDYAQYWQHLSEMGIARDVGSNVWTNAQINSEWLLGQKRTLSRSVGRSNQKLEVAEILLNRKLEGLVTLCINLNQGGLEQAFALKTKIKRTLLLLNQELSL